MGGCVLRITGEGEGSKIKGMELCHHEIFRTPPPASHIGKP